MLLMSCLDVVVVHLSRKAAMGVVGWPIVRVVLWVTLSRTRALILGRGALRLVLSVS